MKKSKFSPQQIIGILREYESGKSASEVSRSYGISQSTLHIIKLIMQRSYELEWIKSTRLRKEVNEFLSLISILLLLIWHTTV